MRQILGQLKNTYPSTEELEFFAVDDLGSRKVVFSSAGSANTMFNYSAYGNCTKTLGADSQWYLASFTGKEYDATGLVYFNARYYDPTLGRFLSEDPSRKGTSWYSYCGNNPLTYTDPTGRREIIGEDPHGRPVYAPPTPGHPSAPPVPPAPPGKASLRLTPKQQRRLDMIEARYKDIEYGDIPLGQLPPGTQSTPVTIPGTNLPGFDVQEPMAGDHYYAYDSNNDGVYDTKINLPKPGLFDWQ